MPFVKSRKVSQYYRMLKTSWGVQAKLFFEHSTLHGVRYIAESSRTYAERFLWFTCVTSGALATIVVIISLWEKFQTNPTITGLDTDFHNWDVPFPALTICQKVPTNNDKIVSYLQQNQNRQNVTLDEILFYKSLTQLSYDTWHYFTKYYANRYYIDSKVDLKELVFNLSYSCTELFDKCSWKSYHYNCCDGFFPVFTENGICFAFNSRQYEKTNIVTGVKLPEFEMKYIQETDITWAMQFRVKIFDSIFAVYILNSDEVAGIDTQPQHVWDFRMEKIMFSVKQTYTTADTAQLSIKQRHCAFPNEIKLKTNDIYSYTACTRECRMNNAMKLCSCIPFYYPSMYQYVHCNIDQLSCISTNLEEIKSVDGCPCYLGCSNTVYEVEKLDTLGSENDNLTGTLDCRFVSWPMVRYKREVLFGWVDLLVSFGGIAGLFLGFSLLSGVEILYYFTIRACCMVVMEKEKIRKIEIEEKLKPLPRYDLSLVPYFISKPLPGNGIDEVAKNFKYKFNLRNYSKQFPHIPEKLREPAQVVIPPFGIEYLN